MFRAAFPTASGESERIESNWVQANLTGEVRFTGTWVTAEVAISIANGYSLEKLNLTLTNVKPDPSTEYRKSSCSQQ